MSATPYTGPVVVLAPEEIARVRRSLQFAARNDELAAAIVAKCDAALQSDPTQLWHDPGSEPWSGADWSNAMCGEAGEAANVVKKLRRIETNIAKRGDDTHEDLRAALGKELADVVIYADLLANHYRLDLADNVREKFNEVSDRHGFQIHLAGLSNGERLP